MDHKHNNINILDFITLITTLLYNTNINSFDALVKILQQLQKCQVENADLLRVAHIETGNSYSFCPDYSFTASYLYIARAKSYLWL